MRLLGQIKNLVGLEKLSQLLTSLLHPNYYLILEGELGVGKTTLTQLVAKNLEVQEKVTSPTFNILQRYQIKDDYYLNHFDFFRLKPVDNLTVFQELTVDNLNIIEWPENNPQFWQTQEYIRLKLVKKENETRVIEVSIPKAKKESSEINNLKKFLIQSFQN